MTLKIAFQMDDIASIDLTSDSTYMLMLEAQNRGFALYYYVPKNLFYSEKKVKALCHQITLNHGKEEFFTLSEEEIIDLTMMDMLFIRQDPPFDMHYITTTYLLDKISDQVKIINDPTAIRNAPEKLMILDFPDFTPKTLITENNNLIRKFLAEEKDIIIKPLYACGGEGVFRVTENSKNLDQIINSLITINSTPLVTQKYLPEISEGDKRVIIACGKVMGSVLRVPAADQNAANFHMGGTAKKSSLTKKQQEIIEKLAPILMAKKLYFIGLDFIGDYITEINVTSPTGIQRINDLENRNISVDIWDEFLKL